MKVLGNLLGAIGYLGVGGAWLLTCGYFLREEEGVLLAISFFAPPAAIVTSFVATPVLGFIGLAGFVSFFLSGLFED